MIAKMGLSYFICGVTNLSKKVFWKLDKIFLRGYIQKSRIEAKEQEHIAEDRFRKEHPEEYYDKWSTTARHRFPVIGEQVYATRDIFMAQFVSGTFKGYDIVVRIMAIEQYYGKNEIGYDLYRKLQSPTGFDWVPRFSKLIESYEHNEFDDNQPIEIDDHLTLMDGAHRLALALYHHNETLPARIYQNNRERPYDYNWFWEMNYTPEQVRIIHNRTIELFEQCKYKYVGVIWPPAFHLREQIIEEINSYLHLSYMPPIQQSDCNVVSYRDIVMDKLDFFGFLRAMYYTDVMTEKGVQWKLKSMVNSMPDGCEEYSVRLFYIDTLNPEIDRNIKNNTAQSKFIGRIKKAIRSRYMDFINNYEYDNIMHISDNYIQSKFCNLAENIDKNVSDLFVQLNKQYDYVVAKAYGRQSKRFPYYYYYYSDVDLLARPKDVLAIAAVVEDWLKVKYSETYNGWLNIERVRDEDEQIEIQVSLRGWRFFLVHVQTVSHFSMDNEIIGEVLAHKILDEKKILYILPPKYDLLIRAADLVEKPHKDWHRKYIAINIEKYDEKLADRAFGSNAEYLQKIKQVISDIRNEQ